MTTATSGVLARFPWLFPIRNSVRVTGPLPSLVLRAEDMWQKRKPMSSKETLLTLHLANGFEAVIGYECQERSNHPFSHSYNAGEVLQCRQHGEKMHREPLANFCLLHQQAYDCAPPCTKTGVQGCTVNSVCVYYCRTYYKAVRGGGKHGYREFRNAESRFSQLLYHGQTLVLQKLTESSPKFGIPIEIRRP